MKLHVNCPLGQIDVTDLFATNPIANILLGIKGARIVTFTTITSPKMNKTGNPYHDKVTKHARVNCVVNFDYVTAYEKREGEGTHAPTRPSSYLHVINTETGKATPFVVDSKTISKAYVQLMQLSAKSIYIYEGKEIDKEIFSPFFSPTGENPVNVRAFKLENVLELTVDGQDYNALADNSKQLREILEKGIDAIRAAIAKANAPA